MTESVQITVNLRAVLRRDGRKWVAGCSKLNVWTQGSSRADAERSLREAVELWVEDCLARGTLDQALREVGFQPVPWAGALPPAAESVMVRRAEDDDVVGSDFALSVSLPAYQAAAFLEAAAAR
jgi:predicted RNase H-like HicB family nuclease